MNISILIERQKLRMQILEKQCKTLDNVVFVIRLIYSIRSDLYLNVLLFRLLCLWRWRRLTMRFGETARDEVVFAVFGE
jgi:hypothetical protein